jgi:hypothetical protein
MTSLYTIRLKEELKQSFKTRHTVLTQTNLWVDALLPALNTLRSSTEGVRRDLRSQAAFTANNLTEQQQEFSALRRLAGDTQTSLLLSLGPSIESNGVIEDYNGERKQLASTTETTAEQPSTSCYTTVITAWQGVRAVISRTTQTEVVVMGLGAVAAVALGYTFLWVRPRAQALVSLAIQHAVFFSYGNQMLPPCITGLGKDSITTYPGWSYSIRC